MHISWEPESSLPESVVREFESGHKVETVQTTTSSYGQQRTTLVPSAVSDDSLPSSKKARLDGENILDGNTGYVIHNFLYMQLFPSPYMYVNSLHFVL